MLGNSFNSFYVVTKIYFPFMKDLKFSNLYYEGRCAYLQEKNGHNAEAKEYILDLKSYCKKLDHMYIIINNRLSLLMTQHITF